MRALRKADPRARRHAVLLVILGTIAAALLIAAFEHYRIPLQDWLLADPAQRALRLKLVLFMVAAGLSLPLVASAAYLWWIGARVVAAREFPAPGQRVIRDTPIAVGAGAILRGRALKVLALCLAGAAVLVWIMIGQWVHAVSERVA